MTYLSGEPCSNNTCYAHKHTPCDVCGRTNMEGDIELHGMCNISGTTDTPQRQREISQYFIEEYTEANIRNSDGSYW